MDTETLRTALWLACRAPSVHNSQPWRWVAADGALHLFVDRRRTLPATDHSGREAIISCGAALHHLQTAVTAAHWQARITRFPDPNRPDHLARVEFESVERVTDAQQRRAQAIVARRTDRLAFETPPHWQLFEPVLRGLSDDDVATLDILGDDTRPRLVEASQLSEELRRDDPSYHAELEWWTGPFALAKGVPPSALPSDTERARVELGRDFPVRGHQDRRAEVAADASKILVLSTPGDTRTDVLRSGEVLSAVLLECTTAGMATCTLTHLIESEESRDVVRGLIGDRGEPQVLVRVGITPPLEYIPAPTPRRPLHDVLDIR